MLFLDSYPPVPLSTWKGGTHSSGFSSSEGAARGSLRLPEGIKEKLRREFSFYPLAREARRTAPLSENRSQRVRCQNKRSNREQVVLLCNAPRRKAISKLWQRTPAPRGAANDAIHFDITNIFSERRCVFRFAHTGISSGL